MMILDADVLIDLWRNHPPATAWFTSLAAPPPVAGFAGLELLCGCQDSVGRRAASKLLRPMKLYWPSEAAMVHALWDLTSYRLSHNLGLVDAIIAATALERNEPLATFNQRHFGAVPGLSIVQPYVR